MIYLIKRVWRFFLRYWRAMREVIKLRADEKKVCNSFVNLSFDKKYIFYFGKPMHSNLGDLAQCICIREFLKENYQEYEVIEIESKTFVDKRCKVREKLKKLIKKEDIIFFHSGYSTQDIGGVEDIMHQYVMLDYPENKMVMLPQTVFFKTEERKLLTSRIYNSHKHLMFLARDFVSFEEAKKMFPDIAVYAYPDIVTTMIGKFDFNCKRSGIVMCLRDDLEKYYSDVELNKLKEQLEQLDKVSQIDTTSDKKISADTPECRKYIEEYIRKLAQYNLVITDRYHGTIFSLAANTPVIVIKTNDHKVRTGVDWFKGVYDDNVMYIDALEDVYDTAKSILQRKSVSKNESYFAEEYYAGLKDLIEKTLF